MTANLLQESADAITAKRIEIMEEIIEASNFAVSSGYNSYQLQKCREDTLYNLQFLVEALIMESDSLWKEYIRWLKFLLLSLGLNKEGLAQHFLIISQVVAKYIPASQFPKVDLLCSLAHDIMLTDEIPSTSSLDVKNPYYAQAQQYKDLLLTAKKQEALQLIEGLADSHISIRNIFLDILQPVQREIGNLWHANKISVAQEHYSTGLTQLSMARLYPRLFNAEPKKYNMVAACVSGELHELGLRMVTDIMEMEGWDTCFLGANTPNDAIIQTILERKADLMAISVTFALNLHKAEALISKIRSNSELQHVKIMVGGYPFLHDGNLWKRIGADSFATDASLAAKIAVSLVENLV